MQRSVLTSSSLAFATLSVLVACGTNNATPDPAASSAPASTTSPKPPNVEWVTVPEGAEPAAFVTSELARAKSDHKKLLVYVGATWCEPCQRFHKAAQAGELDNVFPDIRLVDLDADKDAAIVDALDCRSQLIPLFSMPDESGHCSAKRVEGGIKGDGAVGYIAPRLRSLLGPF
jgi:thiol-disulfide isomerase/thioredoxin